MPFGIFLVLLSKRISPLSVFMRAFGISLALECLQVILLIGSFDVDDLILNSSGGLLGYWVYKMIVKLTQPKKRMADPVLNVIL
ncbi:VanZ like family protein [compost metagenome]